MEEESGRVITKVNLNEEPSVTFKVSGSDYADKRGGKAPLLQVSVCHFSNIHVPQSVNVYGGVRVRKNDVLFKGAHEE